MFGEHLVRGADAGRHPRTRVGNSHDLEQLLHGAVLAVTPVKGDERDIGPLGHQSIDQVAADVDRDDAVAAPLERILHTRTRLQRHLALQGAPALQHRNAAHQARLRGSLRTWASSSSGTAGAATAGSG